MRRVVTCLAGLAAAWAAAAPARAGVYISWEALPDARDLTAIRSIRLEFQSVANPAGKGEKRAEYARRAAALEARAGDASFSPIDRADLGGCYVRLGRYADAVRVLEAGDTGHFLVLTNLAAAYQNEGLLDRAVLAQRRALANWPPVWSPWTDAQWYFYRRVEHADLALLEARRLEERQAGGRPAAAQGPDPVFPGVRFTGPGAEYVAGRIALDMLDRLPPDAPWLVRNLLWSLPNDDRLYWLFGELLNSRGQVEDAYAVLDELVFARQWSNVRELVRHRLVLKERAEELRALRQTAMFRNPALSPLAHEDLLWALAPRPPLAVPVAGPCAAEAAWWATAAYLELAQREEMAGRKPEEAVTAAALPEPTAPAPEPAPAASAAGLPNWKHITAGFVAGLVVATLARLQWNEWRRRQPTA
jgi:tetratricopeptide (TPR) repeat protein